MHDRARAIALLQQARDILVERLTERLLESREAILEDALGMSFSSEIDAVQEQIGQRLNHVNMLLSNMPPVDEQPQPEDDAASIPIAQPALAYEPTPSEAATLPVATAAELVPASSVIYVGATADMPNESTFSAFAQSVLANDLDAAGLALAPLLGISDERGRECAERFQEQLREHPHFLQKAMTLRSELAAGSVNGALLLLWECFGVQGLESIAALQVLKARSSLGSTTS